jgi:hypothetical protein
MTWWWIALGVFAAILALPLITGKLLRRRHRPRIGPGGPADGKPLRPDEKAAFTQLANSFYDEPAE